MRSGALQTPGARLHPGSDPKGRTDLQQVTAGTAEPTLGLEPIEDVLVSHGHEDRHGPSAGGDLESFARLDPAEYLRRILLQGTYANPFHVRQCSTAL